MLLIVESGSTKADWMLIKDGCAIPHNTKGFNPFFHGKEDILLELNDHLELDLIKDQVTDIYFYGAGCSSPELNARIEAGLSAFFINAEITVGHDLLACALSLFEGRPLIASILGTGSNSCYFDGRSVKEEIPALGYILGDEGSGSYFGKRILADYLYGRLPDVMMKDLANQGMTKEKIIENVYMKPDANVYIASFMPTLIKNKNLDYSQKLIKKGLREFIDVHVKCFRNYKDAQVSFVGSVASLLQDELKEVCAEEGVQFGKVVRRPLENLVKYHVNNSMRQTEEITIKVSKN